jgi:hypothetical protein
MKEALSSSEASVLTRDTRRNIPEETILHSHRRESLKSYMSHHYRRKCSFELWPKCDLTMVRFGENKCQTLAYNLHLNFVKVKIRTQLSTAA